MHFTSYLLPLIFSSLAVNALTIVINDVVDAALNTDHMNTNLPNAVESLGCWSDNPPPRTLGGQNEVDPHLTVETCQAFCRGSAYFGVEFGVWTLSFSSAARMSNFQRG